MNTGVTSEYANNLIKREVQKAIQEYEDTHRFRASTSICKQINFVFVVSVLATAALFVGYAMLGPRRYLVEAILLVINLLLNLWLHIYQQKLAHQETIRLLKPRLEKVLKKPGLKDVTTFKPPQAGKAIAHRDGRTYILPVTCLVEGDLIEVKPESGLCEENSVRLEPLETPPEFVRPRPNETPECAQLLKLKVDPGKFYRVLETPAIRIVKQLLEVTGSQKLYSFSSPSPPPVRRKSISGTEEEGLLDTHGRSNLPPRNLFATQMAAGVAAMRWVLGFGVLLYVAVAVIRLGATGVTLARIWLQILPNVAELTFPLLWLSPPLWTFMMDAAGNAVLFLTHEKVQEQSIATAAARNRLRKKRQRPGRPDKDFWEIPEVPIPSDHSNSDSDDEDDDNTQLFEWVDSLKIKSKEKMREMWNVMQGKQKYIVRRVNPLQTLGSITVFCSLGDNRGILSENEPSADHVMVLDDRESPQVLDLTNNPDRPSGIEFEGDFQAYLDRLKPIGINCTLNNSCHLTQRTPYQLHTPPEREATKHEPSEGEAGKHDDGGSLCTLAEEIGVDLASVRRAFHMKGMIYDIVPTAYVNESPRSMLSMAVVDSRRPNQLQILSSGDPGVVLYNCRDFWDGESLQPFSANLRNRIYSILQQWMHQDLHCIAFAYVPIPQEYSHLFESDRIQYIWEQVPPACTTRDLVTLFSQKDISQSRVQDAEDDSAERRDSSDVPYHIIPQTDVGTSFTFAPPATSTTTTTSPTSHIEDTSLLYDFSPSRTPTTTAAAAATSSATSNLASPDASPVKRLAIIVESPTPPKPRSSSSSSSASSSSSSASSEEAALSPFSESPSRNTPLSPDLNPPLPPPPLPSAPTSASSLPLSTLPPSSSSSSPVQSPLLMPTSTEHHVVPPRESRMSGPLDLPRSSLNEVDLHLPDKAPSRRGSGRLPPPVELTRSQSGTEELTDAQKASLQHWILQEQIFTGIVALRDQPKETVMHLVEELMGAGIRFVYFSPDDERKTQAFGSKIGLFTDFNVFISLKDSNETTFSQSKSKLPCGVNLIRDHLINVDNVPLLVSLFTHCQARSVQEMIKIYQENGESVFCMGSSLRQNHNVFLQADIAAALEPLPSRECKHYERNDKAVGDDKFLSYDHAFEYAFAQTLTALPCVFPLHTSTDLRQFTVLICEGRRLLRSMSQAMWCGLACYLCLFLILLIGFVLDLPPILSGYHILWLVWGVIPALSASLLATPREAVVMRLVSAKNQKPTENVCRYVNYFCFRFLPTVAIQLGFFWWYLSQLLPLDPIGEPFDYYGKSDLWQRVYHCVQILSVWDLVFIFGVHSMGFVHRSLSVRRGAPCKNLVWVCAVVVLNLLQGMWTVLIIWDADLPPAEFSSFVSHLWLKAFVVAWALLVWGMDELVKRSDEKWLNLQQRRVRQHFETVLGMHSPK